MLPIGRVVGGVEFKRLQILLRQARTVADGTELPTVSIRCGALVNKVIAFLLVAGTVFFAIKVIN